MRARQEFAIHTNLAFGSFAPPLSFSPPESALPYAASDIFARKTKAISKRL